MPNPRRLAEQHTLRIHLLGSFRVFLNDQEIDPARWRRRKAVALIKLLALEPTHRLHREEISDLLWGEHSPEQVANSFHQTLHLARQILDPTSKEKTRWLRLEDDFLLLAPADSLWTDVDAFEQAAAAAQRSQDVAAYQRAVELYTGALLPDDRFDEWAIARRATLQQKYIALLTALGDLYRTLGNHMQAIELFKQVIAEDSTHEHAHQELMLLYALTGRREQAFKQFQHLRQALDAELDAEPSSASEQLHEQILLGKLAEPLKRAERPSGTLTLLFTDIGGSTALVQRLGDSYIQVLTEHQRILREIFAKWHGYEVDTQGDSFFVVFARAVDGVTAAIESQRAFAQARWAGGVQLQVRMGLHTGQPTMTNEGYAGVDVHRAARLCAAGHPGQVLLSRETRVLVERQLPEDISLRDLGTHRLKDLEQPERIHQLVIPDLLSDFPALRSLEVLPNNLPLQLTSFVGREREIADVKRSLRASRLLTLTGPGGCGKTRLALQVAREVLEEYADGIWLVELASLSDSTFVPRAVATALEIPEQPGRALSDTLKHTLSNKELLIVLDNCEHLLKACAQLAYELLTHCPHLKILATSREALHIAGEMVWLVPSLALPDLARQPEFEQLVAYESLRLFGERAASVQPGFGLTPENSATVARICFRLDGIPLAIELAAARVKMLSVEQIFMRLDDRFHLLTSGNRTALNRQQTLRATIDWGYELLSEPERILFRRLALFAGRCTLDAIEAVCADLASASTASFEPSDVFDLVSSLVDRSLLVVDRSGSEARYRMLETIREYAHQKLVQAQEEFGLGVRYWLWFTTLAEQANRSFWGPAHLEWVERLEQEYDNVRAAVAWCLAHDAPRGARLAAVLWQFWILRGYLSEADQTLDTLLRKLPEPTVLRAQMLLFAFAIKIRFGFNLAAVNLGQESLQIYRESNDHAGSVRALQMLGAMNFVTGEYLQSQVMFNTSLALAQESGNVGAVACATLFLGETASHLQEYDQARILIQESLQRFEELGDEPNVASFFVNLAPGLRHYGDQVRWWIVDEETIVLLRQVSAAAALGYAQANLGSLERGHGDADSARRLYEQARLQFAKIGDEAGVGQVLTQLGNLMAADHEYALADEYLEASVANRRANQEQRGIGRTLCSMGNLAILEGDWERAHLLLNESWELFQEMGDKPGLAATTNHLGNLALAEGDNARAEALHESCVERFQEFGKRHAIALLNWAETARLRGDIVAARFRLESSLKLFQESPNRQGIAVTMELLNELA